MRERAGQVQQQAQGFWQMMESNPVAVGALGTVLGGVAGLLIPETEKEHQLMGETRDRVIGSVQEMAGETVAKAQRVAEEAGRSAMEAGQAAIEEVNSQQGSTGQSGSGQSSSGKSGSGSGGVLVAVVPAGRRPTVGVRALHAQAGCALPTGVRNPHIPGRWLEGSPRGEPSLHPVLPSPPWD